ncbi:MAG TPA: hypothetical protein VKN36_05555 [Eudoraea sp.]|nr:hypothetical protein [Eudoraea sp.]
MTHLRSLVVLSRLTVHQIAVEPSRVRALYTVEKKDGTTSGNELIYSYDRAYFDISNAADVNLASMMTVQVALNYGLFFESIEFDGLFDETDKRFLLDMMENTSREIIANKFLVKNEFLKPPFGDLKVEKQKQYTAAKVLFSNTRFGNLKLVKNISHTDRDQYGILSSGGKDSLLTYGIVKELGEAHPVFINESGRHWFTAINAYRHFLEIEPNTAKPWCNSDRIFNWMVKQMPFIKEHFQNIRSDIYPIRLWTVAVFLFGVLPVARKRKLGNILIGNEYDTTVRSNMNGISHYSGLYDQSKYFDNALTRYYQKKGWNIYQYSILRSLSELLILKILVKRYPDLQRQQVSCHAAHERDNRMFPCGKCEKCRRIIGMLAALGEDPKRCGYTTDQIKEGLNALAKKSIKQIGSDAAHLYHLLLSSGLISRNEHTSQLARAYPEITGLRFDNERSMFSDLPEHIRKPLFRLLEEYSSGAVQLKDRKWHTFVPVGEDYETPYFLKKENDEI